MYKEHSAFNKPSNQDVTIWRYMDFAKLVSLLNRQALFFARATRMPDPFEGSFSKASLERRSIQFASVSGALQQISVVFRDFRKFVMLSCWNINEYESAALWKMYLSSHEGIAIRSTFKRLVDSFQNCPNDIYAGTVSYIDYEKEWILDGNVFYPFLYKRKSFEYEQELRAITYEMPLRKETGSGESPLDLSQEPGDSGKHLVVDLETLIDEIRVAPTAEQWFLELVQSTVRRFCLQKRVERSDLLADPLF